MHCLECSRPFPLETTTNDTLELAASNLSAIRSYDAMSYQGRRQCVAWNVKPVYHKTHQLYVGRLIGSFR